MIDPSNLSVGALLLALVGLWLKGTIVRGEELADCERRCAEFAAALERSNNRYLRLLRKLAGDMSTEIFDDEPA